MPLRKQARSWPHDAAKLRHASLAGGPFILRKGWPHHPAKLPQKWPHDAANRQRKNPFTGQDVEFYSHTLNETELRDAKSVLSRYRATDAGDRRQRVQLPDGVRLEVTVGSKDGF